MDNKLLKFCYLAAFLVLICYSNTHANAETATVLVGLDIQKSIIAACATAQKNNRLDEVKSFEPIIRSWGGEMTRDIIHAAETCLSFSQGRQIVYTFEDTFVPVFNADEKKEWSKTLYNLVAKTEDECRDNDNGVLLVPHNAIEYHDVTGDGVPEEFLIRGRLNCSSGFSLWSGSGGSWISVIVDGVATTFLARSFFVDTTIFNIPILLLSLHGSTCGAVGVQPCIQALVWDEGEFLTPE